MTAPHGSIQNSERDLAPENAASINNTPARTLPEPAPVSKHNLYVLIGCTILAVLMVIFAPEIYTFLDSTNPFNF
ncbi:MAG: hypothetical protein GX898_06370 [Corynebacterium sp.]|uniref:hypothetical protein n=1 Tax=uncultured Corynebacterium sp. TaxID=159447 RepID=UPI001828B4A0|nr:hypothetical protein [uncultured Corynebacterium sp.]NLZ57911.1 hypothetical protein [Corynebacterium sp.]